MKLPGSYCIAADLHTDQYSMGIELCLDVTVRHWYFFESYVLSLRRKGISPVKKCTAHSVTTVFDFHDEDKTVFCRLCSQYLLYCVYEAYCVLISGLFGLWFRWWRLQVVTAGGILSTEICCNCCIELSSRCHFRSDASTRGLLRMAQVHRVKRLGCCAPGLQPDCTLAPFFSYICSQWRARLPYVY